MKARNMILLEISYLSINNLFGKIVQGIFNLSTFFFFFEKQICLSWLHELSYNNFFRTISSHIQPKSFMHLATVPILNSMELFFPKSAQKQLMGKIAVKARNMILLEIPYLSINNLFEIGRAHV